MFLSIYQLEVESLCVMLSCHGLSTCSVTKKRSNFPLGALMKDQLVLILRAYFTLYSYQWSNIVWRMMFAGGIQKSWVHILTLNMIVLLLVPVVMFVLPLPVYVMSVNTSACDYMLIWCLVNAKKNWSLQLSVKKIYMHILCATTLIRCNQEQSPKRTDIIRYACANTIVHVTFPRIHSIFSIPYWFVSLSSWVSVLLLLINLYMYIV